MVYYQVKTMFLYTSRLALNLSLNTCLLQDRAMPPMKMNKVTKSPTISQGFPSGTDISRTYPEAREKYLSEYRNITCRFDWMTAVTQFACLVKKSIKRIP